jgi:3-phosphoglycerate kinase
MGVKMTEEIRKLAQFFMKPFPLDVNLRHIKKPQPQNYFTTKFSVVIGGLCRSNSDILDKILLINQFLSQASKIYLAGEVGLAAVCALLGEQIARVEHNTIKYTEFSGFFRTLIEKSKKSGCEIVLPQDILVATKLNREQVMLGLNEDKSIPANVVDANAVKGASALSKGAPPAKPNPSLVESS